MRICVVGKYPPIQGGVSEQTHATAHELARRGHDVRVVTNSDEVEPGFRAALLDEDVGALERDYGEGRVRLLATTPLRAGSYIPWAQPHSSKLFGLGSAELGEAEFDGVVGWYLEPYGVVAAMLSETSGVPFLIRHAGSDIGRLASHPQLGAAYKWVLHSADRVLTTTSTAELVISLGADPSTVELLGPSRLPAHFTPEAQRLDFNRWRTLTRQRWGEVSPEFARVVDSNFARLEDPEACLIGVYGKIDETKGSFDLLEALDQIGAGQEFTLVGLVGGHPGPLARLLEAVLQSQALRQRTVLLPFIAPWHVPGFIGACDVVCCLERDFPITFHAPRIPLEVLSVGSCLVCSAEIASKQIFGGSLIDGRTCRVVDDPRNTSELARTLEGVIGDSERHRVIAARGRALVSSLEKTVAARDAHADAIEAWLRATSRGR
jgi:glycosyltransferase involved in cell wall biosynthesis